MAALATVVFRVGTALLALGAVGFAAAGARRAGGETRKFYGAMALATGATALGYAAMSLGIGAATVAIDGTTRTVYWPRFVAWLVVAVLVSVVLWWLADAGGATLATLLGTATVAALGGAVAALGVEPVAGLDPTATRFGALGLAGLGVLGLILVSFRRLSAQAGSQPGEVGVLFSVVRNVVALVWLLFLVAWAAGPVLGVLGVGAAAVAFLVLDAAATLGVGAVLLRDDATLARA